MGRGRSSGGGSSRGSSSFGGSRGRSSYSSSRGSSSYSSRGSSSYNYDRGSHRTTVIIGGSRHYHSGDGGYSSGGSSKAGYIIGAIMCFIFSIIMCFVFFGEVASVSEFGSVSGTCVDNEYMNGWYYTTYTYNVDGENYRERSMEGWEFAEEIGKVVTIYYDKDDPEDIMESKPVVGVGSIVIGVIGIVLGVVGIILVVKVVKMGKNGSDGYETSSSASYSPSLSTDSTQKTCTYCGSKYNSGLDSCPKCGGR